MISLSIIIIIILRVVMNVLDSIGDQKNIEITKKLKGGVLWYTYICEEMEKIILIT